MLSINNIALPSPGSLTLSLIKPQAGDYLNLLGAKVGWPGLTKEDMQQILMNTAQSFTLGCLNPRTGLPQGFTAKLTGCDIKPLPGSNLYEMNLTIQEIA